MKKKMIHILVAEDDKYFRMALKEHLADHAIITEAESEAQAIDLISKNYFDIALIDMDIDGPRSGLNILKEAKIKKTHSIILSSQNDNEIIEKAYQYGCDHFLMKRHFKDHLLTYINKYKKILFGESTDSFFEDQYITNDQTLRSKITEICKVNLKGKSILITGETGVGKSLVGKLLHAQTYDNKQPFVHINCSEISENLIESELFGHKKGAFTGALEDKIGKLELANGGTLFLDEIATMPMVMQKKLLKALDEKSFYPVGSNQLKHSDFTLITATCEDLFDKIHRDEFRKDLFFRISGINLHISSLKERPDDIPTLAQNFLKNSPRRIILSDDALKKLKAYHWPGNIRELKKVIDYLSIKDKGIISSEDISFDNQISKEIQTQWLTQQQQDFIASYGFRDFIARIEAETLRNSLQRNNGKITHVIKELKISSSAFYRIYNNLEITH